jgi:hypothetical protein
VVSAAARVATPKDASPLAELGARTFRRSSPNTRHEDVESYVGENFTRDKLLGCLRVKNSAALIIVPKSPRMDARQQAQTEAASQKSIKDGRFRPFFNVNVARPRRAAFATTPMRAHSDRIAIGCPNRGWPSRGQRRSRGHVCRGVPTLELVCPSWCYWNGGDEQKGARGIFGFCHSLIQRSFVDATSTCAKATKIASLDYFDSWMRSIKLKTGELILQEQIKLLEADHGGRPPE